jgi:hypothetical protein
MAVERGIEIPPDDNINLYPVKREIHHHPMAKCGAINF